MSTIAPFQAPDAGFAPASARGGHTGRAAARPQFDRPVRAPVIATERLLLRRHRLADVDAWYDIQSDPEVVRYLPWPQRTRAESRAHLERRTHHNSLQRTNDFLALAVELDGVLIGDVSMHLRAVPASVRQIEAGWLLHSAFAGRGLALEATRALLSFAFDQLGARSALAMIDQRNDRSLALASRLGFGRNALVNGTWRLLLTPEVSQRTNQRRTATGRPSMML